MEINFVSRSDINITRSSSSKYKPLLDAVKKLEPGGKALEVSFKDESELNAMRNVIYEYNKKEEKNIRSTKHPKENLVYFYKK